MFTEDFASKQMSSMQGLVLRTCWQEIFADFVSHLKSVGIFCTKVDNTVTVLGVHNLDMLHQHLL